MMINFKFIQDKEILQRRYFVIKVLRWLLSSRMGLREQNWHNDYTIRWTTEAVWLDFWHGSEVLLSSDASWMAQGTNVMPCSLIDWLLLHDHRIPFSLHRSNWITLRPSPCPIYPTPLNISSHRHTYIYQTTWYHFQGTVIFPLNVMETSYLTHIMIFGTWYKSQHCKTHTHIYGFIQNITAATKNVLDITEDIIVNSPLFTKKLLQ
jgi:hypothetical protein